jgi:S1-C subfamily serine protease
MDRQTTSSAYQPVTAAAQNSKHEPKVSELSSHGRDVVGRHKERIVWGAILLVCAASLISYLANHDQKSKAQQSPASAQTPAIAADSAPLPGNAIAFPPPTPIPPEVIAQAFRDKPVPSPEVSSPPELKPAEIDGIAIKSVVSISSEGGGETSYGSGFYVGPHTIATNYHVIENSLDGSGMITVKSIDSDHRTATATIVAWDALKDLALLDVRSVSKPPLSIATQRPDVGEPIYVESNPLRYEGTFSVGNLSAYRNSSDGQTRIQITAAVSHGSSGAPVLDAHARVIAVVVELVEGAQNINFAIPASDLKSLIDRGLRRRP